MAPSTSRRSASAKARAIVRIAAGRVSAMLATASTSSSGGADLDLRHPPIVGHGAPGWELARRQRAMVMVTMANPKPRSSTGAQTTRGPRIWSGS
jgi:hypothetical protein